MEKELFCTPRNGELLYMENGLLKMEIQYLRAQLNDSKRDGENRGVGGDVKLILKERLNALTTAENELKMLLEKLSIFPVGNILRMKKGYRNLEKRFLQNK